MADSSKDKRKGLKRGRRSARVSGTSQSAFANAAASSSTGKPNRGTRDPSKKETPPAEQEDASES
jgi:hypothetical protein